MGLVCDDWMERLTRKWKEKQTTPREAIKKILPGNRVYVGTGCSEPLSLVEELINEAHRLRDVEIIHFLTVGPEKYFPEKGSTGFRHNALYIGEAIREEVQAGRADYTPVMTSQIGNLFRTGKKNIDVALIQVSPPDEFGFCSLGVAVDFALDAVKSAFFTIAEINPNMPRTHGEGWVHMKQISHYVISTSPLLECTLPEPDEVDMKIAAHISTLIRHKSCLHLGLGTISRAVLMYIAKNPSQNDLGVHTFAIYDELMPLIEQGIVTCRKKNHNSNKIVTCNAMGTQKLYDFVKDNPYIEFLNARRVCNPADIARNDRMVSINEGESVDLTGQVNTATRGYQFYSGVGDTADFILGSAFSKGGKPIIALRSLTPEGHSAIVTHMTEGAGVLLSRATVHYVVTEWGVAYLHGKTIRERVVELINIAHPDHRQALLDKIKERHYVYADQILPLNEQGEIIMYPRQYETLHELKTGERILIRPVKVTDEARMQELCYALDTQERYMRYFYCVDSFEHEKTQAEVAIDYNSRMTLGAFVGEVGQEEMIGSGSYDLDPRSNLAEISVIVRKDWHRKGIAGLLLNYLAIIARERNIRGFCGTILQQNFAALKMIRKVFKRFTINIEKPDTLGGGEEVFFTVVFEPED